MLVCGGRFVTYICIRLYMTDTRFLPSSIVSMEQTIPNRPLSLSLLFIETFVLILIHLHHHEQAYTSRIWTNKKSIQLAWDITSMLHRYGVHHPFRHHTPTPSLIPAPLSTRRARCPPESFVCSGGPGTAASGASVYLSFHLRSETHLQLVVVLVTGLASLRQRGEHRG